MTTSDHGHIRDGHGRFTRSVDTADRDAEACRLRSRGMTLQQIADRLGFADRTNARRAISRALAEVVREDAEQLVTLQLDTLDALTVAAWSVLHTEHPVVSAGRIVHGPDGRPLVDPAPVLAAVDRLLRIQERRARLLGLDAPAPHRRAPAHPPADIDAAVAELAEELAVRTAYPSTTTGDRP